MSDCTVSDNSTSSFGVGTGGGGGISNNTPNAVAQITNSTISRNIAVLSGGGIDNKGNATIFNSTLSDNETHNQTHTNGGNIYNSNSLEIGNTILKVGTSWTNLFNGGSSIVSHGYNISNDDGGGLLTATGDQITTDPMLGSLRDNGGPTFTQMPLDGVPLSMPVIQPSARRLSQTSVVMRVCITDASTSVPWKSNPLLHLHQHRIQRLSQPRH